MNTPAAAAAGIGAIISLETPATRELALESVEIDANPGDRARIRELALESIGETSVQADANVVAVSDQPATDHQADARTSLPRSMTL